MLQIYYRFKRNNKCVVSCQISMKVGSLSKANFMQIELGVVKEKK